MIGARALWVLAQIARRDDGDLRAARVAAYGALDPLVRGLVRGKVQRAVADAMFETERADDEPHVHRLALVRLSGDAGGHPDDVDAVAERFEGLAPTTEPGRRAPSLTLLGVLAVLSLLGGALLWWFGRPPAALHADLPESAGAWAEGGRPGAGDDATRALFERGLPRYVTALDAFRAARSRGEDTSARQLDQRRAELAEAATEALGPDAASFFTAALDQSRQVVESGGAADSHLRSIDALNAAIASRGLGYYVDAEVLTETRTGQHRVYLSTFTVERVRYYRVGDARVRALRLKRLDHLNFARAVLGFTRPQVSDALVLLGRVEGYLVNTILPGVAEGARMPLVDEGSRSQPWATRAESIAARDARAELDARLGPSGRTLAEVFARRRRIFDAWEERFGPQGLRIARPSRFDFDVDDYTRLESRVSREEWRELAAVARESQSDETREAYRAFEEAFLVSVERHEVQHRLDYAAGTLEGAMPPALEALVGPLDDGRNRRAQRALAELSAYLSELARGPSIVRTNLALFAQHVLNQRAWGSAECYAALVVFEGLADRLGVTHDPLIVSRRIDREALVDLYAALRSRPAAIAPAAAELWAELFGHPLPTLVLDE